MAGGVVWAAHRSSRQQADAAASQLADARRQDVAHTLEQVDLTLKAVIGRHQSAEDQTLGVQSRNAPLFKRAQSDPYFAFINVLDENGGFVAGMPMQPQSLERPGLLQGAAKSVLASIFDRPAVSTEREDLAGFPVGRRMTDSDGMFAGVVVMGVRLAYFRSLLDHPEPASHDSVTLLRDDGVVLMRLPFDLNNIGRTLDRAAPFYTFMRNGSTPITAVDPIDSVERRFVFRRVGSLPLVVSVGTRRPRMPMPVRCLWWLLSACVAIVVAAGLLLRGRWREGRRRQTAEHESREKSRFLTTLSHELRTPLHGVLGYAEQLSQRRHPQPRPVRPGRRRSSAPAGTCATWSMSCWTMRGQRHWADAAHAAVRCAARRSMIVLRLLHPARGRGGSRYADRAGIRRSDAIRDGRYPASSDFGEPAEQRGEIYAAGAVSNCVSQVTRRHLTFEVADTGIGIPEGAAPPFVQGIRTLRAERTNIEGTGLGLAISHRLARRMGGDMGHRDNAGGGSVFWLTLPGGVADEFDVVAGAEALRETRSCMC